VRIICKINFSNTSRAKIVLYRFIIKVMKEYEAILALNVFEFGGGGLPKYAL
jgi:hypothetical protein